MYQWLPSVFWKGDKVRKASNRQAGSNIGFGNTKIRIRRWISKGFLLVYSYGRPIEECRPLSWHPVAPAVKSVFLVSNAYQERHQLPITSPTMFVVTAQIGHWVTQQMLGFLLVQHKTTQPEWDLTAHLNVLLNDQLVLPNWSRLTFHSHSWSRQLGLHIFIPLDRGVSSGLKHNARHISEPAGSRQAFKGPFMMMPESHTKGTWIMLWMIE